MEAKDTAMNEGKIQGAFRLLSEMIANGKDIIPDYMRLLKVIADKQADITWDIAFKAGMERVVSILSTHNLYEKFVGLSRYDGQVGFEGQKLLSELDWWQAFKKENGLDK